MDVRQRHRWGVTVVVASEHMDARIAWRAAAGGHDAEKDEDRKKSPGCAQDKPHGRDCMRAALAGSNVNPVLWARSAGRQQGSCRAAAEQERAGQ